MNQEKEYLGWLSKINQAIVITFMVVCALFLFAMGSMLIFQVWPKTFLGWIVALFAIPAGTALRVGWGLLVKAGVNRVHFLSRLRQDVLERNEGKTVSFERIAYILFELIVVAAILGGAVYGIYRLSGDTFDPVISFFKENYY